MTRASCVGARSAALLVLLVSALLMGGPAAAHHKPGHTGGPGSNCEGQPYPPAQCDESSASVDRDRLQRGERFVLFAQGFRGEAQVALTLFSTPRPLGVAPTDDFGYVETTLTVPEDAELGQHDVVVDGTGADGSALRLSVPVTVVAAAPGSGGGPVIVEPENPEAGAPGVPAAPGTGAEPGPGGAAPESGSTPDRPSSGGTTVAGVSLPRTGAAIAALGLSGAAAVALGVALLAAARRRVRTA